MPGVGWFNLVGTMHLSAGPCGRGRSGRLHLGVQGTPGSPGEYVGSPFP